MRMNNVINEGSSSELVVAFVDENGLPSAPSDVVYRVDCATTGQQVRNETTVTPADTITISLIGADTDIITETNASERRRVTVIARYGTQTLTGEYDYVVRNLRYV